MRIWSVHYVKDWNLDLHKKSLPGLVTIELSLKNEQKLSPLNLDVSSIIYDECVRLTNIMIIPD